MITLFLSFLLSSCAILPDAYQAVGKNDDLKKLCDVKKDAKACYLYGTYLRDQGDKNGERVTYYKKSCDQRYVEGCQMYRKYLAQSTGTADITKACEAKDFQACYQGGFVAYDRGEKKEALNLHTKACDIMFESSACENKKRISQELEKN